MLVYIFIASQLENICKLKDCEKLRKWQRSIKNHIYWTASSSTTGPERVAKWRSILIHVRNIHTHEDFPACLHPQKRSRNRNKWLVAGMILWKSILFFATRHLQKKGTVSRSINNLKLKWLVLSNAFFKYFLIGTQAFYKLQKVMTNKRIMKDVTKLSPHHRLHL